MVWHPHQQPLRRKDKPVHRLSEKASIALLYHDIFDYPLRPRELNKWLAGHALRLQKARPRVESSNEYFFLKGREGLVYERLDREYVSRKKMKLLASSKHVLEGFADILMVGITGSLAMVAAKESSDIDLMIITKKNRLWSTRLKVFFALLKSKIAIRRAGEQIEEDRLCINIWMDESDLVIKEHNAYIAHELAQITPLINRENTCERLLAANSWIGDYWPNAVSIKFQVNNEHKSTLNILEKLAFYLQKLYMSRKVTRETVTPTRAFFHPFDWSKKVNRELARRGVVHLTP